MSMFWVTAIVPKNPATPTTRNVLKILEPNIFPIAIWGFPFLAAMTETASSGRLVPRAMTVAAIMSFPMPIKIDNWTTASTVYFALIKINSIEIINVR